MSQTLLIWENYLVVFVSIGIYCGICFEICREIYLVEKNILKKNHRLLKFALGPPLGGRPDANCGRPWNLIHSPPCRTPCRLFIHKVFFGPLGLHLREWSELGRSPPIRPMRGLRLQWSWAFNLACEVALSLKSLNSLSFGWNVVDNSKTQTSRELQVGALNLSSSVN